MSAPFFRVLCEIGRHSIPTAFLRSSLSDVKSGQVPRQLAAQYARLKATPPPDLAGAGVATLLSEMALRARLILADTERVGLFSPATGKPYFSFRGEEQSRPISTQTTNWSSSGCLQHS
jgi:hypothetical protein